MGELPTCFVCLTSDHPEMGTAAEGIAGDYGEDDDEEYEDPEEVIREFGRHPMMDRVQEALYNQLLQTYERVSEELRDKEGDVKKCGMNSLSIQSDMEHFWRSSWVNDAHRTHLCMTSHYSGTQNLDHSRTRSWHQPSVVRRVAFSSRHQADHVVFCPFIYVDIALWNVFATVSASCGLVPSPHYTAKIS